MLIMEEDELVDDELAEEDELWRKMSPFILRGE